MLKRMINEKRIPVVTAVILALNLIGYLYELIGGQEEVLLSYGMFQGALEWGEWYRIITSEFLHFDLPHLACNMLCLFSFGLMLENDIGRWKFAVIYAAAIAGAGLLIQYAGGARALHAGASGAVWGLMFAALVYVIKFHGNPAGILRGIALNLIYSFSAQVSWQGHIGGGIAGLIAALILLNLPDRGGSFRKWKKSHPDVSDDFYYGNRR